MGPHFEAAVITIATDVIPPYDIIDYLQIYDNFVTSLHCMYYEEGTKFIDPSGLEIIWIDFAVCPDL